MYTILSDNCPGPLPVLSHWTFVVYTTEMLCEDLMCPCVRIVRFAILSYANFASPVKEIVSRNGGSFFVASSNQHTKIYPVSIMRKGQLLHPLHVKGVHLFMMQSTPYIFTRKTYLKRNSLCTLRSVIFRSLYYIFFHSRCLYVSWLHYITSSLDPLKDSLQH